MLKTQGFKYPDCKSVVVPHGNVKFPAPTQSEKYEVDTTWSKEFEAVAPKRDQHVITGGHDEHNHAGDSNNWTLVVPEKFEAVATLTFPKADGTFDHVERRLGPGLAYLQLFLDSPEPNDGKRISLWISGKQERFELTREFGKASPDPTPILRILNPGESAELLNRPVKDSLTGVTLDLKLQSLAVKPDAVSAIE